MFYFSCVERRFGGGKTEDEQSQKERCRLEVHGHNGEIKRNKLCEKLMNEKSAISKKSLNECIVICKIVRRIFSRINY